MKIGLFLSLSFVLNRRWEQGLFWLLYPLLAHLLLEKSCTVIYGLQLLEDTSVFLGHFIYFYHLHHKGRWHFAEMNELLKLEFTKTNDFEKDSK